MNHLPGLGIIWSFFVPLVFAAQSLTASDVPKTLDEKSEMQVTVSLNCAGCADSYLRGVFYPSGTSYFGYTQDNTGKWSNAPGSGCKEYYAVLSTDLGKEGTWSGSIKVKPDTESSTYTGPGEYLFKVGRYPGGCGSPSSGGWSNESIVAITGPTHTPTPAPSATPNPTDIPHPTATHTPSPASTPMTTPILTPSSGLTPPPTTTEIPDILGESSTSGSIDESDTLPETNDEATVSGQKSGVSPFMLSFLCIGVGFALLSAAVAWQKTDVWKKIIQKK